MSVCSVLYGEEFRSRVAGLEVEEVVTVARSPWQNAYAERLIGSIRRECLDHLIVFNERELRRILREYFAYLKKSAAASSFGKESAAGSRSRAASKRQNHFSAVSWRIASALFAGSVRGIGHTVAGWSYRSNISPGLGAAVTCFDDQGAKSMGTLTVPGRELKVDQKTKPPHGQTEFSGWTA